MKRSRLHRFALYVAIVAVAGACATAFGDDARDFMRYKTIIDRSPFGSAQSPGPEAVQPNFASRYGFVGLVGGKDGKIAAIVEDRESNPRRTYFAGEGDTFNSVKVSRIEREPSRIVLQQGIETATLAYEPRTGSPAPPPQPAVQQAGLPIPAPPGQRRTPFIRRIIENE